MTTSSKKGPVQTRLSRCPDHGLVQATRQMPRLRFPFIVTGVMWLAALGGAFRCPECGAKAAKP
jgi:hypothetical protein